MGELKFLIEETPEDGSTACAISEPIISEANTPAALYDQVRDAARCHFTEERRPRLIRLHFVRDEVIAV